MPMQDYCTCHTPLSSGVVLKLSFMRLQCSQGNRCSSGIYALPVDVTLRTIDDFVMYMQDKCRLALSTCTVYRSCVS